MKYFRRKTHHLRQNFLFGLLAVGLFLAMPALTLAAPGDLDLSFGSGGIVTTPIADPPYTEGARAMRVQTDGKIVVCGVIDYHKTSGDVSYYIARYNSNGTLDDSFGTNGKIIAPYNDGNYSIDIALQPDGKIIAAGQLSNGFAVHRYHSNGTLDASFGTGGVVIMPIVYAASVAVQADGKIIVVGHSGHFTVVRYNPDGSLDTSFNGTGIVSTSVGGFASYPKKVILQPDSKIVAVGEAVTGNGTRAFGLVRYNADGSLDSGFGAGGKVIHAVSPGINFVGDAALQPDGKIVVSGGQNSANGSAETAIVRYNQNGSIDTSFAANGIFTTEANFYVGNAIALQSNGKLLAFGIMRGGSWNFAILRLNPNGTPDVGFGNNGRVITPNTAAAAAGAVQSDGKILAFGIAYAPDLNIALVRYLGDSAAPRPAQFDFDGDRRADISVFRPSDRVWYLNQSTNGLSAAQFGLSTDKITPADFDGDGKTDIAVFRDGTWYLLRSTAGFLAIQYGQAGDIPVPFDYTGDGRAELAVYRSGFWHTLNLATNQSNAAQFGNATDKPVPADYDGDGRADYAVYRDGIWYLLQSTQGFAAIQFGLPTDKLVPADYDGDGKTDAAVYRDGIWYVLGSQTGFTAFQFGTATDTPAPADYDGDGRADAAVFRDGVWYLRQSTSGISAQQFGLANDTPVPAAYLP